MWRRATIRKPLRSRREMISPVSERAKASGFTRIKVRSMDSFTRTEGADQVLERRRDAPRGRVPGWEVGAGSRTSSPEDSQAREPDPEKAEDAPTKVAGSGALTAARSAARDRAADASTASGSA